MVINTNLSALRSVRQMAEAGSLLSKALGRLSSGSRILSPEDDAAGLAQAFKLGSQARRVDAVNRNNSNLISFLQTQDGFLSKVSKALDRMGQIAVLSKDQTKTARDVSLYQEEFDQLQNFISNIYSRKFNGVNLFSDTVLRPLIDSEGTQSTVSGANLAKAVGAGNGEFTISLTFTGDFTDDQKNLFYSAANRWQSAIMADLVDVGAIDDLSITVNAAAIDGAGGVLGNAAPGSLRGTTPTLPVTGTMNFDTADLEGLQEDGRLYSVILHEMGHVLGIGSLWDAQGLKTTTADGPQYVGLAAVAEYEKIFGTSFGVLPVEDDGGAGTAGVHPEELSNRTIGGVPAPGLDNEIMTGFAESGSTPMPLSSISIGFLDDLGYEVDYGEADPYSGAGTGTGPRLGLSLHSVEKIARSVEEVANLRAQVGANLAKAFSYSEILQVERESLTQTVSRIEDTDVAAESVAFTKARILMSSGSAMLAQANLIPEMTLRLLNA